ncbi:phosphotyrosine protein phosphatase [Candidatus Dojkabacteria bacterium]|uniref:Phosphotyrosine protein phosphatase n=1 Tax=Candidatus Dojkabacteria bacterium TaxID=2099670 RepID=A0A955HYS9_9BACT|nr:phosphotyrosine protein phosphatase [Candidatus Dojkabacteria bacterium]MCB9791037.1 phosphotyrosine protein phosphatase [Candidatus Nomurabacteria bacterium]
MKVNLLFVCGRNKKRSKTAEKVYSNTPEIGVRSAGVSSKSPHAISEKDLLWADVIFVMEAKYREQILHKFKYMEKLPEIIDLEIPDLYEFMDPKLVSLIKGGVREWLQDNETLAIRH